MEHIELAGVHSGDSACIIPSVHITAENVATIKEYTKKIAEEMHVVGLMNMQYAIEKGKVYVLEANPRASRTVPLVSKVCNVRMVPIATDIITSELTGRPSPVPALKEQHIPYYGVKEAVFPFNMFPEVDPILGPEMRSTGEVLGLSTYYGEAFYKAQEATQTLLPTSGTVLISVNRKDKDEVIEIAQLFEKAGFKILATSGTYAIITAAGVKAEKVKKLQEGRPNINDLITNGSIDLIINSPSGKESAHDDSYLRKAAIKAKIPYVTTIAGARATAKGILYVQAHGDSDVKSLQELHSEIEGVASGIAEYVRDGWNYNDVAILYRTNAQSRALEEKLMIHNIPYKIYGGQNFYQRKEIKDILAYLKTIDNGLDGQAVKRIINVPKRGIGNTTIDRLHT